MVGRNREKERRLLLHAFGVFAGVLLLALLLTAYIEHIAIRQERDRMEHIATSIGSETYETLLSEMGKTRVLEAYLIQTGGSYEGFERIAPIFWRNPSSAMCFSPRGAWWRQCTLWRETRPQSGST